MRIDISDFDGQFNKPEEYIEWEASLDRYFEYKNTTPEGQYKLAKIKLMLYGLRVCRDGGEERIGQGLIHGIN